MDYNSFNQYDKNKKTNTIYVSKEHIIENGTKLRYVDQILTAGEQFGYKKIGKSVAFFVTQGGKQKVKATLYQTSKNVPVIYICRQNIDTGNVVNPQWQVCICGKQIKELYSFLNKVLAIDYYKPEKFKITEEELNKIPDKAISDIISPFSQIENLIVGDKAEIFDFLNLIKNNIDKIKENKKIKIDLDSINKSIRIKEMQNSLMEFKEMLENSNNITETSGNKNWQDFINKNNWMFGVNYLKPIEKQKISISGNMPDFIFPTLDGFLDILEIKTAKIDKLLIKDNSHTDSYYWSSEVVKAIGQVSNYLQNIEDNRLQIENKLKETYNIDNFFIKPRGYILIGKKLENDIEKKVFRSLSSLLHNIEIFTFTDLFNRANNIINLYNKND